MQPFNWVIENQPMVSLNQHSQVGENNLDEDGKGHWKRKGGSCHDIHLYYRSDFFYSKQIRKLWVPVSITNQCLPNSNVLYHN